MNPIMKNRTSSVGAATRQTVNQRRPRGVSLPAEDCPFRGKRVEGSGIESDGIASA